MLHVAIVEDSGAERERLREYIETYCRERGMNQAAVTVFPDGEDILKAYPEDTDIILLDIEMEKVGGMEAARKIRLFDKEVQILFVTQMVQYAIEGYSVDAADFLVKPIRYPVFCSHMDRVVEKIRARQPRYLVIKCIGEQLRCRIQDIAWIESTNKKTQIHLRDGNIHETAEPLYSLEKMIAAEQVGNAFYRCHKAFLVNMQHISAILPSDVVIGNARIPVSKHRKKDFMKALATYKGRMF